MDPIFGYDAQLGITIFTPAAIADLYGSSSRLVMRVRESFSVTGRRSVFCVLEAIASPGKCLAVAATPVVCCG